MVLFAIGFRKCILLHRKIFYQILGKMYEKYIEQLIFLYKQNKFQQFQVPVASTGFCTYVPNHYESSFCVQQTNCLWKICFDNIIWWGTGWKLQAFFKIVVIVVEKNWQVPWYFPFRATRVTRVSPRKVFIKIFNLSQKLIFPSFQVSLALSTENKLIL